MALAPRFTPYTGFCLGFLLAAGAGQASILAPTPAEQTANGDDAANGATGSADRAARGAGGGERVRALENEIRLLRETLADVRATNQDHDSRIQALKGRIRTLEQRLLKLTGLSEKAVTDAREEQEDPSGPEAGQTPAQAASADTPGAPGAAAGTGAPEAAEAETATPDAFQKGFQAMKDGDYRTASDQFRAFLAANPDSNRRDKALFWLGESLYVKGQYGQALRRYERLIQQFPDSPMKTEAMYKMAFSYYHLSDFRAARQTLLKVLDQSRDKVIQREAERLYERVLQARGTP